MNKQIPRANPGLKCPLWKQDMSKVCHNCPFWTLVRGAHPQTGEDIDNWNCAIAMLPMLLMENANQQRQHKATTESFRNEVVGLNGAAMNALMQVAGAARTLPRRGE